MSTHIAPATAAVSSGSLVSTGRFRKLFAFIFYAFVGITIISIFVPLNPRMPACGLDPSWEFAMNQAVARHMHIGKDIVFTYGPYAALMTHIYDPATDLRMMLSSLVLGACFGCSLLFVARGRKRRGYAICRCDRLPRKTRACLIALCTVLFFIVFKHGFLEPSGMSVSFATLTALIFVLALVFPGKRMAWPLIIALAITTATSVLGEGGLEQQVHERFGIGTTFSGQKNQQEEILAFCIQRALPAYGRRIFVHGWETYESAFEGLLLRAHGEAALRVRFADAEDSIRSMKPVPQLTGTVDEYEEEQSALLVSPNRWDPRPEFLSYSAYTPELAGMNEQHLRGAQAPDWVLFHIESIQNRLPTLDDGMSWPALLDNYSFSANYGQFVLLHRNGLLRSASRYQTIETAVHGLGEKVELPDRPGIFFAQVVLKPTVAGKAALVLLNPPQLRIVLNLANGQTMRYRVIAKMMTTGFLLSPAVRNDAQFTSLTTGSDAVQKERVRSFSIEPIYGGPIFWSRTYELTLRQYAK